MPFLCMSARTFVFHLRVCVCLWIFGAKLLYPAVVFDCPTTYWYFLRSPNNTNFYIYGLPKYSRLLRAELLSLRRKGALKIGGGLIGNGCSSVVSNGSPAGGIGNTDNSAVTDANYDSALLQQQQQLQQQQLQQNNHNLPNHPLLHESNRHCARCSTELGRITNRGAPCRVCKLRVCKACREFTTRTTDWVCVVCHKQM